MDASADQAGRAAPGAGSDRVWQARPDLLYRRLVDGGMIYDRLTRRVHHLNAAAAVVWEACADGGTGRALAAVLAARFGIDAGRALADAAAALDAFAREGLLRD